MTPSSKVNNLFRNIVLFSFLPFALASCSGGGSDGAPTVQPPPPETISRISVSSGGVEGNGGSGAPVISDDGRYIVFVSDASNLVDNDTNNRFDVFLRDTSTGMTTRVSLPDDSLPDSQGNDSSTGATISGDGRYIAFRSAASNLVPGDTNDQYDIFVRDTATNQTIRVSVDSSGNQGDSASSNAAISSNGLFVAFDSYSTQLVNDDNNNVTDVFVRDISAQTTSRVSVSSGGSEGDFNSSRPDINGDGRFVAFHSDANNLVPEDTNNKTDVFIHDMHTHETNRISVNVLGEQGDDQSYGAKISNDGSLVFFASRATNLTDDNNDGLYNDDTNGVYDLFVSDWQNGTITKITRNANGESYSGYYGSISDDGRFIVFRSSATNLTEEGGSGTFIYDRANDTIELIDGTGSDYPTMSADGKYIGFSSLNALVENDTNATYDVFRMLNNR